MLRGKLNSVPAVVEEMSPGLANDIMPMCDAGAEIYLRNLSHYGVSDGSEKPVLFSEVAEKARQHKETALGYIMQDGTVLSAPDAHHKQMLHVGDRVIALADQA